MRSRIMYIEDKSGGPVGPCRIGRVTFSKTGATLRYAGRSFQSLKGYGFKANYLDVATGQQFWISGPRRDGADGLYGRITQPEDVDLDIAEAYWRDIRGLAKAPNASPGSPFTDDSNLSVNLGRGRKASRVAKLLEGRD